MHYLGVLIVESVSRGKTERWFCPPAKSFYAVLLPYCNNYRALYRYF